MVAVYVTISIQRKIKMSNIIQMKDFIKKKIDDQDYAETMALADSLGIKEEFEDFLKENPELLED